MSYLKDLKELFPDSKIKPVQVDGLPKILIDDGELVVHLHLEATPQDIKKLLDQKPNYEIYHPYTIRNEKLSITNKNYTLRSGTTLKEHFQFRHNNLLVTHLEDIVPILKD